MAAALITSPPQEHPVPRPALSHRCESRSLSPGVHFLPDLRWMNVFTRSPLKVPPSQNQGYTSLGHRCSCFPVLGPFNVEVLPLAGRSGGLTKHVLFKNRRNVARLDRSGRNPTEQKRKIIQHHGSAGVDARQATAKSQGGRQKAVVVFVEVGSSNSRTLTEGTRHRLIE